MVKIWIQDSNLINVEYGFDVNQIWIVYNIAKLILLSWLLRQHL